MRPSADVIAFQARKRARCADCELFGRCIGRAAAPATAEALGLIEATGQLVHRNDHLYRAGDAFQGLFVVKAGCVKVYVNSQAGEEQVLGFYMPGELLGFDGMADGQHQSNAVAVGTGSVCELAVARLERLSSERPAVHRTLLNWSSAEVARMQRLVQSMATRSADGRLAAFLVDLSDYHAGRGFSGTRFSLPMLRSDIGRHLGLAVETISRVINRLRRRGLVSIERQAVTIVDEGALRRLADPNFDQAARRPSVAALGTAAEV